jgi:hypothetical protein
MTTTNHTSPSGEELKPCPFCGGAVELEQANSRGAHRWWGVVCRNTINLGGTCAIEQIPSASREAATERWNRRAAVSGEDAANGAMGEREAFDVALDALSEYQRNWDTGLPAEYASAERIAMECAVEAVREALNESRAELTAEKGQEPVAWVDEKAEVLVFGGWDKQPFAKSYRPVFYAIAQPVKSQVGLTEAARKVFDLANHFNVSGVYFTEDETNREALQALEDCLVASDRRRS